MSLTVIRAKLFITLGNGLFHAWQNYTPGRLTILLDKSDMIQRMGYVLTALRDGRCAMVVSDRRQIHLSPSMNVPGYGQTGGVREFDETYEMVGTSLVQRRPDGTTIFRLVAHP